MAHALHANVPCCRAANGLCLDGHLVPVFQSAEPRQRSQFLQQEFHGLFDGDRLCLLVFQNVEDVPVDDGAGLVVDAAKGQVSQAHVDPYNMHLTRFLIFFGESRTSR